MQDARLECVACGETLAVRDGSDRCQCPLCELPHVVDRASDPPSVRATDAGLIKDAIRRAQDDLKAVRAEVRFFEEETKAGRVRVAGAVLGVLAALAAGAVLFETARRAEPNDPSKGTFLMPGMSKEEQTRVAQEVIGVAVIMLAVLTALLLPWRRWREPAKTLVIARGNLAVIEDLVRRLTERVQPPSR